MPTALVPSTDQKKPSKQGYVEYKDSGLGHLLSNLNVRLADIRKKYPLSKHPTPEEKEAVGLLSATETIMDIAHHTVLPKFSKGVTPSLWSFLSSALSFLKLLSIKKNIFIRENSLILFIQYHLTHIIVQGKEEQSEKSLTEFIIDELEKMKSDMGKHVEEIDGNNFETIFENFKSQIRALNLVDKQHLPVEDIADLIIHHLKIELNTPHHPMTYELLETLVEFIRNAPLNAADLVNFLNPVAIPELIKNIGILGEELQKHGTTSVEQIVPEPDSSEHPYKYEVVSTDPHQHGLWDVEEIYTRNRAAILDAMIVPATRRYLAKWGERDASNNEHAREAVAAGMRRMKSDLAHAAVLQSLKDQELVSIDVLIDSSDQARFIQWSNLDGIVGIEAISQRLTILEAYLENQHSIQTALENKRMAYATKTMDELLQEECQQTTRELLSQHQGQGLDLEYCSQLMPDVYTYVTEGEQALPSAIPLKKALNARLDVNFQQLEKHIELVEGFIEQVIENTIILWKQEQAVRFQKWDDLQQQFRAIEENSEEKTEAIYAENTDKRSALRQQTQDFIASIQEVIPDVGMVQLKERFQFEASMIQQRADQFIKELTRSEQTAELELHAFRDEQQRIRSQYIAAQNLRLIEPHQLQTDIQFTLDELNEVHTRLEAMRLDHDHIETERLEAQENIARIGEAIADVVAELARGQEAYHAMQPIVNPLRLRKQTIEQTLVSQELMNRYTRFQPILIKIKAILEGDLATQSLKEKPKLSFSQIDKEISASNSKKGFNELLDLIDSVVSLDKEAWLDYRSRQNDFGRMNPKPLEFQKMAEALRVAVEATYEIISSKLLTDGVLRSELVKLNERLDPLILQETSLTQCQITLEQEQTTNHSELERLNALSKDKAVVIQRLHHDIQGLDTLEQQLNRGLTILHQFKEMHDEMQALKLKLQGFIQNGGAQLAQRIADIKSAENLLIEKLNAIHSMTPTLKEPDAFEKKCTGMQQLLDKISLDIAAEIETKLDQQVTQYESFMADDKQTYARLDQQSTQLQPEQVEMFSTNCKALNKAVELHQHGAIWFKAGFESVQDHLSSAIRQRMERLCASTVESDLITIPMVDALLKQGRATARRIECAQFATKELDTYLRHRDARHKTKDFFSSKDRKQRHLFVEGLKQQLESYKSSPGLDKQLLKAIAESLTKFPGVSFRTVLNKITVALLDSKGKFVMDKEEKASGLVHGKAMNILTELEKSHAMYVAKIKEIEQKIQQMKAYGERLSKKHDKTADAVIAIALQLQNEVDAFAVEHGVALPNKELFDDFSQKFIATLHSHDDVMSKHGNDLWWNIVANILLSLFLIPKLIYSKVTTGRCSFFYETTKKTAQIQSIEESAYELKGEYSKESTALIASAVTVAI